MSRMHDSGGSVTAVQPHFCIACLTIVTNACRLSATLVREEWASQKINQASKQAMYNSSTGTSNSSSKEPYTVSLALKLDGSAVP